MPTLSVPVKNEYPAISNSEKELLQLLNGGTSIFNNPLDPAFDKIKVAVARLVDEVTKIEIVEPASSSSSPDDIEISIFPIRKTVLDSLEVFLSGGIARLKTHSDRLSGENLKNLPNKSTSTAIFGVGSGLPYLGLLITIASTYNGMLQRMGEDDDGFRPIFGSILNQPVNRPNRNVDIGIDSLLHEIYITVDDKANQLASWYREHKTTPTITHVNVDGKFSEFMNELFHEFPESLDEYSELFEARSLLDNRAYTAATNYLVKATLSTTILSLFQSDFYSRGLFQILLNPEEDALKLLNAVI